MPKIRKGSRRDAETQRGGEMGSRGGRKKAYWGKPAAPSGMTLDYSERPPFSTSFLSEAKQLCLGRKDERGIFEEVVEELEELTHDGSEGEFGWFGAVAETFVESA